MCNICTSQAGSAVDTDSDLVVDSDLVRESNEATPAMRVAMETSRMSNEDDVYSGFEEVEEDSRQLQVSFAQSSGPDPVILSEPVRPLPLLGTFLILRPFYTLSGSPDLRGRRALELGDLNESGHASMIIIYLSYKSLQYAGITLAKPLSGK